MSRSLVISLAIAVAGCAPAAVASRPASHGTAVEGLRFPLTSSCALVIADADLGRAQLGVRDDYVAAMSPLDRQIRLGSRQPVDEAAYLDHVVAQVRTFRTDEAETIGRVAAAIAGELATLGASLPLPGVIHLVKTTGREETGSDVELAYTRRHAIVINEAALRRDPDYYLRHELFHVISREAPALRDALYAVIGHRRIAALELPPELEARRLTNPDAPRVEHVVSVLHGGGSIDVATVLLASRPYDGGGLFDYVEPRLVVVDGTGAVALDARGAPRLLAMREVPGFLERVGYNTRYLISPEEILADGFVLLLRGARDVPSPWVLEGMRAVLRGEPADTNGTR